MSVNWRTDRGVRPSPHVFSRGNTFFSTSTTSQPASASQYAHAEPEGPPPTTSTSCRRPSSLTGGGPAEVAVEDDLAALATTAIVGPPPRGCVPAPGQGS